MELLSIQKAAKEIGVSRQHLTNLINAGKLKKRYLGGRLVVRPSDITDCLTEENTTKRGANLKTAFTEIANKKK